MVRRVVIICLAVCILAASAAGAASVKVTLRAQAEVTPAKPVTVGDLASVSGPAPQRQEVARVVLTSGPLPGASRTVDSSYIRTRLAAAGLSKAIDLDGADRVSVVGICTKVEPRELIDSAKAFLLELLPATDRTYEVTVQRVPREVVLTDSDYQVKPRLLGTTARPGVNTVALDVVCGDRVVGSTSTALNVAAAARVLVATAAIRQGGAVDLSNTAWEMRDIGRVADAITEDRLVQGAIARRSIRAGATIRAADVLSPLAVRKGDTVAVVVKYGKVTIRTTGEVREDGRTGDTIRIRAANSKEDVRARITGPETVEISL